MLLLAWSLSCTVIRNITHRMTHFRVNRNYTTILTTEMITITEKEKSISHYAIHYNNNSYLNNHIVLLTYLQFIPNLRWQVTLQQGSCPSAVSRPPSHCSPLSMT